MSWKFVLNPRQSPPQQESHPSSFLERVRIRPLTETDLPALEWEGEYAHFRKIYAEAFHRMQIGQNILWIAELPGAGLVGQVFIQLICDRHELADGIHRAYFYSFRVRKEYRNQGVGSRIMETVEDDLRKREFSFITLNVAKDNPRAQKLYFEHGYRIVAPEPGIWSYQDDKGIWHRMEEPAWRMEKKL